MILIADGGRCIFLYLIAGAIKRVRIEYHDSKFFRFRGANWRSITLLLVWVEAAMQQDCIITF